MNITVFACGKDVFTSCECIKGFAFKMAMPRGKSAHLAVINALRTASFAVIQDNCAHFDVKNILSRLKYAS